MSKILLSIYPEKGHYRSSFKLARSLAARGHEVRYLARPDFGRFVAEQGFAWTPLFPDLYPEGTFERERREVLEAPDLKARLRAVRRLTARHLESHGKWTDGTAEGVLEGAEPDVVLADTFHYMPALLARRRGTPCFLLDLLLPYERRPGIPPAHRFLQPRERDGVGEALGWLRLQTLGRAGIALRRLMGVDRGSKRLLRELGRHCGLPASDLLFDVPFYPFPRLPRLVLCPRAFDFPRAGGEGTTYVEASVDRERREPELPGEKIDSDKPLVYASFGSQAHRMPAGRRLYRLLVEVFRRRPALQLVLATGHALDPERLAAAEGGLPANVLAVREAPQLSLLRRADLAVTHGGLGSIKECLLEGVPMLVLPLARDQPGNAARVAHHGLGRVVLPRAATAESLGESLDRLLLDGETRRRVEVMSEEFRRLEREQPGVARVEEVLRHREKPVPVAAG